MLQTSDFILMIRNYLKIAFRNLAKYKLISFINIFGLTVGLTCCLLIVCYIKNELSGNIPHALQHIEATWKKFLPETPYTYTFPDNRFGQLYDSEQKQGILFTVFSCIAIFIACPGLFGLSAFATTQRIKEIGIRKVPGANVSMIARLLSTDFLKLVVIAAVLAFPVAWYAMHRWLQDFAYRIDISWWVFVLAGALAVVIAMATISFQAFKAAVVNPSKSLRTE